MAPNDVRADNNVSRSGRQNVPRVLHVIGAMDRGGAETFIMNVYRNIDRSKLQFDFLVHETSECDYDSEILSLGGKIFTVPRFHGVNLISYFHSISLFFKDHHDYLAVHIHIGSCAPIIISVAKSYGVTTIAHSHNTKFPLSFSELAFRLISYPTRFLADILFACSKQAAVDRFGHTIYERNRCAVVNNGIDTARFQFNLSTRKKTRVLLSLQFDNPVFIHVGRFDAQKNHDYLVDVFSAIVNRLPNAKLLLVGRGPLEQQIKNKVCALGIERSVVFLGIRSDIPALLMSADAFLFPSIREGLGIALIEAQATGLPCLVSDAVPRDAFITDRVTSLSLADGPSVWAERAIDLINENVSTQRLSYAKEVEVAGFDIKKTAHELERLYLSLK